MLAKRVIGCVLIENGFVVRRVKGKTQAIIGKPEVTIKYLQDWDVDEVAFICLDGDFKTSMYLLDEATEHLFLPLSFGGAIQSVQQVRELLKNGAEKVIVGRHKSERLINEIAEQFGKQAVVVSVDENHEQEANKYSSIAGEIILHDISRDGTGEGLNLGLAKIETECPKLLMGGVGDYQHVAEGLKVSDGVIVGNLFHYKEISATLAKKEAKKEGLIIR